MSTSSSPPAAPVPPPISRWFGLDIHKEYLTAVAVNAEMTVTFTANKISWAQFQSWARKLFTLSDSIVIEMTTNTWEVYDFLKPLCHSVIVVHPPTISGMMPHNAKTDKHDATQLAQLHAAGLLAKDAVWIPPAHVRELRTLIANRYKVVRMASVAKNRLHNVLHRHHLELPTGKGTSQPFSPKQKEYWLSLPNLSATEKIEVEMNWDTITFATAQKAKIEDLLKQMAAKDEAALLLQQIPGIGIVVAMTILGAIGDIARFKNPTKLVGYAGLGAKVTASGGKSVGGRITKAGRKDLRHVMVEAASHAIRCHPRWKREFARLEPRLGKNKAKVAIARRMLIMVWHLLSKAEATTRLTRHKSRPA
ncbi:MAG: IS110 family transposase [Anaerolineae bacterium]|nr:IS110 family transposase [Anaerolineae bacterium]